MMMLKILGVVVVVVVVVLVVVVVVVVIIIMIISQCGSFTSTYISFCNSRNDQ